MITMLLKLANCIQFMQQDAVRKVSDEFLKLTAMSFIALAWC